MAMASLNLFEEKILPSYFAYSFHTALRLRRNKSLVTGFSCFTWVHVLLGYLLLAAGSVSSGNLSTFDVIGRNVHQIMGHNIVSIGNKETKLPIATPCR